jgi:hypothetical protein
MMSTQVETPRVSAAEAVTREMTGTPFGEGIRGGVHADIRTESRGDSRPVLRPDRHAPAAE